jgi:hypothetical protein
LDTLKKNASAPLGRWRDSFFFLYMPYWAPGIDDKYTTRPRRGQILGTGTRIRAFCRKPRSPRRPAKTITARTPATGKNDSHSARTCAPYGCANVEVTILVFYNNSGQRTDARIKSLRTWQGSGRCHERNYDCKGARISIRRAASVPYNSTAPTPITAAVKAVPIEYAPGAAL